MANNENLIPIPGRLHSVATEGHVSGADEIYDDTQQKDQETINSELIAAVGTGGSVDSRIAAAKAEIIGNATSACDTLGAAEALISAEATARQSAISNVIGDATTDYNTLGKLEDKIQAEASAMESAISAEVTRAEAAEEALDGRVDTLEEAVGSGGSVDSRISAAVAIETTRAQGAESTLQTNITAEATRAQTAEDNLQELYEALTQSDIEVVNAIPASGVTNKIYRVVGQSSYADYMFNSNALTTPIKMAEYNNAIDDEPTAGSDNLVKSDGIYNSIWQNVGFLRGSYTIVQSGVNTIAKASFKKRSYSIHIELGATETNTYFRISQGSTDLCVYFIRPGETSYDAILELSDDYDDCEIQIGSGIGNDVYFEIHEDVSLLQNTHDIAKLQKSAELYNIINGFSNSDIDSSSYFLYSATRATLWIPTTNFSPYSIVKLKSLSDTWKFGLQLCKTYHNAGSSSSVYDSGWIEGSGYSDSVPLNKNLGTKVPYIAIFATDIETSSSVPTFEQFISSMKIEIVSYIDFKNTTNNALTKLNASSVDALQVGYYWSDSSRSGVLVDADNFDKYSIVEIRVKSKEAMDSYGLSLCKKKSVNTYIWSGDMTDFNSLLNVGEHYQDTAKWLCLRVAPKSGHSVLTLQEINDALDIKIYNYVDYISHQVKMINKSGLYSPYEVYQYSGEKISLNCMSYESYIRYSYNIDSQKYREGCNCYGGVLFQFNIDGANVAAYDYNTKELLEVKAVPFLDGCHCNLVSWGKEKYAADDEFPLLYISNGVYSNHEVIVVRITRASNTFTYTKVQTITITDSNEYAANVAIDIVTGKGWLMTNEKANYSIADNDFYIRSFDVPSLSSGDVTIDVQDMSERITIDGEIAMQGFCPIAGKLYIPSGFHNNSGMIRVVDTMKKTVVSKISLIDIGIIVEPEQVFLYNGVLHLATASYLYKLFF